MTIRETVTPSPDDLAAAVALIERGGLVAVPARDRKRRRSKTADTNDRRTPRLLFEVAARRFGPFVADVAASRENALCSVFLGPGSPIAEDALSVPWNWGTFGGANVEALRAALRASSMHDDADAVAYWAGPTVFCNPPYGPTGTLAKWIAYIREQRDRYGTRTLMLGPGDHSVEWLRSCVREGEVVENLPFRVKFDSPDGSTHDDKGRPNAALAPSVMIYFAPTWESARPTTARTSARKQAL